MYSGARLAVDAQVTLAAEFDRRVAHSDADLLATSDAQAPQLAGGERRGGDRGLRKRADGEGGGQQRLGAAQLDGIERLIGLSRRRARGRPELSWSAVPSSDHALA